MPLRKKPAGETSIGRPTAPWMVSYSDLVTQLLVFFVMLFALSSTVTENQLKELQKKIDNYVLQNKLEQFVSTRITQKEGLVISFQEKYMFDSGKADLYPEAKVVITDISRLLVGEPNRVSIEGHTDNWPISTPEFPSNWELSTTRATNILRFIIENIKFDPKRFTSAGYGENHPDSLLLASVMKDKLITEFTLREWKKIIAKCNNTVKKRARNRRVDIVIRRIELDEMRIWREQKEESGVRLD
jgi:chemotaxis protein MotB